MGRTYCELLGGKFPSSLQALWEAGLSGFGGTSELKRGVTSLLDREHWLVLYDPQCRSVAIDLESRFSEAALGSVKLSDLRNFAHGRHHWLAKYPKSSAILVLSQPNSRSLANQTLDLVPKSIPRLHLALSDEPVASLLAGILASMHIAGWMGEFRKIDPGRPGVPEFGRRLYNLTKPLSPADRTTASQRAIERKAGLTWNYLDAAGLADLWQRALDAFRSQLESKPIRAIVFDYDGTLVSLNGRFEPATQPVADLLDTLLRHGIIVGIATGRGRSARKDLRQVMSQKFWPDTIIGYHNGAEISSLDDDSLPNRDHPVDPAVSEGLRILQEHSGISSRLKLDPSPFQIGVQWEREVFGMSIWQFLEPLIPKLHALDLTVASSGHSVDILAPGISKRSVATELQKRFRLRDEEVLCIGDQGRAPGNDSELLAHFPSLSVAAVSQDPRTCWRLSPAMISGPSATVWYLSKLTFKQGAARFRKGSLAK